MGVRRARKQVLIHPREELVCRIGEIAGHFLLDSASLLRPLGVGILDLAHAGRVHPQDDVEIRRRNGRKILGDVLLRVGVVLTT